MVASWQMSWLAQVVRAANLQLRCNFERTPFKIELTAAQASSHTR